MCICTLAGKNGLQKTCVMTSSSIWHGRSPLDPPHWQRTQLATKVTAAITTYTTRRSVVTVTRNRNLEAIKELGIIVKRLRFCSQIMLS